MYWADAKWCRKEKMDKRRISGYLDTYNVGFIISFIIIYHAMHAVHAHAGAIRKSMCGTSDNPLS